MTKDRRIGLLVCKSHGRQEGGIVGCGWVRSRLWSLLRSRVRLSRDYAVVTASVRASVRVSKGTMQGIFSASAQQGAAGHCHSAARAWGAGSVTARPPGGPGDARAEAAVESVARCASSAFRAGPSRNLKAAAFKFRVWPGLGRVKLSTALPPRPGPPGRAGPRRL